MGKYCTYLRLSKEDDLIKDESNSISNQRKIIEKFVYSHDDLSIKKNEFEEFVDDGFSGASFQRPAIMNLLDKVKNNEVECIIVKDFSRFSRDYIEAGTYIERIFPYLDVRFIAINDNYDSINYKGGIGEIDISLKNLLNDFYCKELSANVKAVYLSKRKEGKFLGTYAPYGYQKNPENKYQLIVDQEAANVVEKIFRLASQNIRTRDIAKELNESNIPTPLMYQQPSHPAHSAQKIIWTSQTINAILRNEVYQGTYVARKTASKAVSSNSKIKLPKSEWIRIENNHEAIVSRGLFEKVRSIKAGGNAAKSGRKKKKDRLVMTEAEKVLSSMLYCGHCGHTLIKKNDLYVCRNAYYGGKECQDNQMEYSNMYNIISKLVNQQMQLLLEQQTVFDSLKKEESFKVKQLKKEMQKIKKQVEKLESRSRVAYEQMKDGKLNKEQFLLLKQDNTTSLNQIQHEYTNKEKQCTMIHEKNEQRDRLRCELSLFEDIKISNALLLEMLIEKINVFSSKKMVINWNLVEEYIVVC